MLENKDLETHQGDFEPASGPTLCDELLANLGHEGLVVGLRHQFPGQTADARYHDSTFWRAFGQRWASRIMPARLKELMRHASIKTTLRYYVGTNAERTADACWEAYERACGQQERRVPPATGGSPTTVYGRVRSPRLWTTTATALSRRPRGTSPQPNRGGPALGDHVDWEHRRPLLANGLAKTVALPDIKNNIRARSSGG